MIRRKGEWEFEFKWDDVFYGILALFLIGLATFILFYFFTSPKLLEYSLDDRQGRFVIVKQIDWAEDSVIELDRSTTVQEAIRAVDSLNRTLTRK